MKLQKYSIGTGDRFGFQGKALLRAILKAEEIGINLAIVWNKSHREHLITKTTSSDVLNEAQQAVKDFNWKGNYYIDADHIGLSNVGLYIDSCNFFTLDVAEFIGIRAFNNDIKAFIDKYKKYIGKISIPNIEESLIVSEEQLRNITREYIFAIKEAGKIYRKIKAKKGKNNFIIEISMDESSTPQTPIELLFILALIAEEKIPLQTFAPRFHGNFYKGIDYIGNIQRFAKEFEILLAVIQFAVKEFSIPNNLKLSIHSGSDKFSIYDAINKAIKKFNTGVHLKTSGTTWLEELAGLVMVGDEGLKIVKEIYKKAYNKFDELCIPYRTVINIKKTKLPLPKLVNKWTGEEFVRNLRHDITCKDYNPNFRQLLHIGYKIAAEMGSRYTRVLKKNEEIIGSYVTENIYERHIVKLFR
ncbi:MAG: tagaturonate epimerase family protein [Candidatus Hodarchaeota archaeon]